MRGFDILLKVNKLNFGLAIIACIVNLLDILVFKTDIIKYICLGVYNTIIIHSIHMLINLSSK